MRKTFFIYSLLLLICGAGLVSCYGGKRHSSIPEDLSNRTITFSQFNVTEGLIGDDFISSRAAAEIHVNYLKVIDVVGGEVIQTVTRSVDNGDDVCADLTLNLSFGSHDLYFVSSANMWHEYDEDALTLRWNKETAILGDVWSKHLSLTVDANTASTQSVSMNRVVAYVKVVIEDALPSNLDRFQGALTGGSWTFDIQNQCGGTAALVGRTVVVPSSSLGNTGVGVGLFTFVPSGATSATSYVFSAFDASLSSIASVTFNNVPIEANHYTTYSGKLFTSGPTLSISVNGDWATPNEYSF